jgi:nicotinamide mononucleotide transporter
LSGLLDLLILQAQAWSVLETLAVVLAIAYLLLAIRENIWCWFFAGISTAIYVYLFITARLYMESALNVFYFAMAIYGWSVWYRGRTDDHELPVSKWAVSIHAYAIAAIIGASLVSGFLLDTRTDAAFPYIDSLTTWAAIWATFLVARKVLENWWYWLVIDLASIFIYWSRDLQLTSVLFVVYVIMIPFGLISWTRTWKEQQH